ncbi:MAG TPA: hypothetical protein VEW74_06550, partial [Candidatus Nitrosotalea sp.]|nr:hypothetical protein [Candidatus Nitrosotalea sp.]
MSRVLIISSVLAIASAIILGSSVARAQTSGFQPSNLFQIERPGHAEATLFGGGFGSDKYGTTQEGF